MKISVKPDKTVLVSFPFFVSEKEIFYFLAQNENWIRHQQQQVSARKQTLIPGTVLKTKTTAVELCSSETCEVKAEGTTIKFYSPEFNSDAVKSTVEDLLTNLYRIEARKLLPPRLKVLAETYGFSYRKVTIRNNKRNWGSCSSRNNISLNLQMMKLPDELIDYILLHELVHTEIKDHSVRFWRRLDQLTQNRAKEMAKEIKKYSTYTL